MLLTRNRLDSRIAAGGTGLICYLPLGDPLAPGPETLDTLPRDPRAVEDPW